MKELILVIDDDPMLRAVVRKILETEGYTVMLAESGREGLDLLERFSPAVIITDLIMPGKGGIETIVEMRKTGRPVKIIAISGGGRVGNTDLLAVARKYGADEIVAKPFEPMELVALVARHARGAAASEIAREDAGN